MNSPSRWTVSFRLATFFVVGGITIFSGLDSVSAQSCTDTYNSCKATAVSDEQDCIANAPGALQRHNCVVSYQAAVAACTADYNACNSVTGYINPKYVVLGVTYAPPGSSSSVTYAHSTSVDTETSLANTFTSSTTYGVEIGSSTDMGVYKGGIKIGTSTTASQSIKDSQSLKLSWSTNNSVTTVGVPDSFNPVSHDYDLIYVWLNPVEAFSVSDTAVTWTGYGYDATDQNGMDIVGIELGYLNGHFGAMPPSILALTNRSWANDQMYAAGQSAALNSADFAQIAQADPFNDSGYGINIIGYNPPSPSTADNRFTISACNSRNSVDYLQAAPSQTPATYTCTLSYSNLSTQAQTLTSSTSNTFSFDKTFTGGTFFQKISVTLKFAYTQSTMTEANSTISTTQASSATLSIVGPACNNQVPYTGPCVPVYDASGTDPVQFYIYQDNLYGTFSFIPVHYY